MRLHEFLLCKYFGNIYHLPPTTQDYITLVTVMAYMIFLVASLGFRLRVYLNEDVNKYTVTVHDVMYSLKVDLFYFHKKITDHILCFVEKHCNFCCCSIVLYVPYDSHTSH